MLLPAIQKAAADGEVRIVIVMPKFEGLRAGRSGRTSRWASSTGASGSGLPVTDVDWMRHGVDWFGWMTPGEVKHFPLAERASRRSRAAGTDK